MRTAKIYHLTVIIGATFLFIPYALPATTSSQKMEADMCLADSADVRKQQTTKPEKPDWSCAISVEQSVIHLSNAQTVLVDVRDKTNFDRFHISGAINLKPAEVKTKSFLRGRKVILIGNGKSEHQLYGLCRHLKSSGNKNIHVIRGGIISWLAEGKPVAGRAPDLIELVQLAPADLFLEYHAPESLTLITPAAAKLKKQFPLAINTSGEDVPVIKEILARRSKETKKNVLPIKNIVMITNKRFDKRQVVGLINAAKPIPLLIYADTEAAYLNFLQLQTAMWNRQPDKKKCSAM